MAPAKTSDTAVENRPDSSPDSKDHHGHDPLAGQSSHERSQSIMDVFTLEGLTLYEKKCVLVNREIDSMGMGKYQWCLWGLCGGFARMLTAIIG